MFKRLFLIIIINLLAFSCLLEVNAAASYSGDGVSFTGSGGRGSENCDGGYCLRRASMIKFTLVQPVGDKLVALSNLPYGLMKETIKSDYSAYFNSNPTVRGMILENGNYNYSPYALDNFFVFSDGEANNFNISNILLNSAYLNFNEDNLRAAILTNANCREDCEITSGYENVVLRMLKRAGKIDASIMSLDELSMQKKSEIAKYRMIIEPVYTLKKVHVSNYIFATPKAIAQMIPEKRRGSNPFLGVQIEQLYDNLKSVDPVGDALNVGAGYESGYKVPAENDIKSRVEKLASPRDGAGYAVVKLIYEDVPNLCQITREADNSLVFSDGLATYPNDGTGDNFERYIEQCSCNSVNIYPDILDELKTSAVHKERYDNICTKSQSCSFESEGTRYVMYDKDGNKISDYNSFISSCGCKNVNVIALTTVGKTSYNNIYKSECQNTEDSESATSNLRQCEYSVEDYQLNYEKKETNNNYCKTVCTENVKVNNFASKNYFDNTSFLAGKHFSLPGMFENDSGEDRVSVTGTKTCTTNIMYDEWEQQYEYLVNSVARSYNNARKYETATKSGSFCCRSEEGVCVEWGDIYTYSYDALDKNNQSPNLLHFPGRTERGKLHYCSGDPDSDFDVAKTKYQKAALVLNEHLGYLTDCNNHIKNMGDYDKEYYNFVSELEFGYQQEIYKSAGNILDLKVESLDKYYSSYNNRIDDIEEAKTEATSEVDVYYYKPKNKSSYALPGQYGENVLATTEIFDEGRNAKRDGQEYTRTVSYKFYYRPAVYKYAEALSGRISDVNTDYSLKLGYYFDLDVTAKAKNGNPNYFEFKALGEQIPGGKDRFTDWNEKHSAAKVNLKRECSYNIINDVICKDLESCISFKIVDPGNIDPNDRMETSNKGFENWKNEKGKAVKAAIEKEDTYNPANLEYSFTLDSATMKAIREDAGNYSSVDGLECDDNGNHCMSAFIDELKKENGEYGNKVAKNTDGRKKWKYLIYNEYASGEKWKIEKVEPKSESEYNNLLNTYREKGVTP